LLEESLTRELRAQIADLKAQVLHLYQLLADEQQQNESLCQFNSVLQKRIEELTKKTLCVLCHKNPRNSVFMPCLHFISCEYCIAKTTQCLTCGQKLNGFLRVKLQ
jgi:hypothetical protein